VTKFGDLIASSDAILKTMSVLRPVCKSIKRSVKWSKIMGVGTGQLIWADVC